MQVRHVSFPSARGELLDARLDLPDAPTAYALFAHCFTCSKDIFAASRISQGLVECGIAVLRFDFTGLGHSEGEFANTNFSSNVADIHAAADWMGRTQSAPALLVGHSLGGSAVLSAAASLPAVRAVATLGAPSDPAHVTGLFPEKISEIETQGEALVQLAGRPFRIRRDFLADLAGHNVLEKVRQLRRALLILHSPADHTVPISHAASIFGEARHPKSFVSLDGADHLLTRRTDAVYAAKVIAVWAERYLADEDRARQAEADPNSP